MHCVNLFNHLIVSLGRESSSRKNKIPLVITTLSSSPPDQEASEKQRPPQPIHRAHIYWTLTPLFYFPCFAKESFYSEVCVINYNTVH